MNRISQTRPRMYRKNFDQFMHFLAMVKSGKKIILIAPDYVALDIESYEELVAKANPKPQIGFGMSYFEEEFENIDPKKVKKVAKFLKNKK